MRRCVAHLVTSLAKPREGKVIFSAVKAFRACFPTAIRSSARNSKKIFHINRTLTAAIFYFVQLHRWTK
jgi:hypothetical protein